MKRRDRKRVIIVISCIVLVIVAMIIGFRFIPGVKLSGLKPVQKVDQTVGGADGFASNDTGKTYEYQGLEESETTEVSDASSEALDAMSQTVSNGTELTQDDTSSESEKRSFAIKTLLYGDHYFEITKDNKSIELKNPDTKYGCVFSILSDDDKELWKSEVVMSGKSVTWNAYEELSAGYNSLRLKYEYYDGDKRVGNKSTILRVEVIK